MSDRTAVSPQRAYVALNEQLAANLRRVNRRILSPSSTSDTFTVAAQALPVQSLANPAAPFTTIASLAVDAGSWLVCGTTSVDNDRLASSPPPSSGDMEVICRLSADGVTLAQLDYVDPFWFAAIGTAAIGHNFAPIARATFTTSVTVTLEVRVSLDVAAADSLARRTRLVVSPY